MSIIYDALKKIRQAKKPARPAAQGSSRISGHALVFGKLFKSRVAFGLAAVLLIITVIGYAVVYVYQDDGVPSPTAAGTPPHAAPAPVPPPRPPSNKEPAALTTTVPPAPLPADDSRPAGDGITVSNIAAMQVPAEPAASLVVPVAGQKTALPGKDLFTVAKDPFLPKPSFSALKNVAHNQPKLPPRLTMIPGAQPARVAMIKSAPVIASRRRQKSGIHPFSHTGPKQKISSNDIPHLNHDFKDAVAARDYIKSSGIITRIARLLGPKAIYVRKLQAFLYLRENKPAKAGGILRSILREDSNNLEAGLNMIVVLIKEGKVKAARQRTRQLLDYYPGNRTLLHFQQQLEL